MKQFGIGCLVAVVGVVVGALVTFGLLQLMASSYVPPPAPILPSAQSDVSITASAAFINAQLQQAVKQSGLAKQATITLASPNVIQVVAPVDASAFGFPITVNATVSLRVLVQRGRVVLAIEKVDAGGVALAQSMLGPAVEKMRASAEDQLNRLVQRALQGSGLSISNVRVTPVDLTVDLMSQ